MKASADARPGALDHRPAVGAATDDTRGTDYQYHHKCPGCGQQFGCDWRAVAILEEQAARLKIIAGMWRAKLLGVHIGRPRLKDFDEGAARELVASGLSLRAVGQALGVGHQAVARALKAKPG